jgi:hypothetical protein
VPIDPGSQYAVTLTFQDDSSGTAVLADPSALQLDITYGSMFGTGAPDFAGPFSYSGASGPTPGQIYRTGVGQYRYDWTIPASASGGVYVATWTITYGGIKQQGFENILVAGGAGAVTPPDNGEIGYWTGSLTYGANQINFGAKDANGTAWAWLGIDGMGDAPTDGSVLQRGSDHGGYATPQFYGPRPLTLRVRAAATSQAARDAARAALQAAVPVSDLATLVYNEPVPKTVYVRRSGGIKVTSQTLTDVDFAIGLIAPDPRKYGAASSVTVIANSQTLGIVFPLTFPVTFPAQPPAGSATITNNGNFETRPTITISGPIDGPSVYNQTTGQTISFSSLTMTSTDTLVLDLLNKVAYLNGSPVGADLWSSWWVLEPGSAQVVLQGAAAVGAEMTINLNDAWM